MDPLLIALGALVIVVIIGFVISKLGGANPSDPSPGSSNPPQPGERPDEPDIEGYPAGSRPGGPGAESMNTDQPGDPVPGAPTDESATADAVKPSDAAREPLDGDE